MPRAGFTLLLLAWASFAPAAAPPQPPQWIAVVAPAFKAAIAPLAERRRAEGMKVVVLTTTDVLSAREIAAARADRLRDRLRQLCRQHPGPSHILLVGAVRAAFQPEQTVVPPL